MEEEPALIIRSSFTTEQIYAVNHDGDGSLTAPPEPVDEFAQASDHYIRFEPDEYRQIFRRETAVFVPKDSHFIAQDDWCTGREWLLGSTHAQ